MIESQAVLTTKDGFVVVDKINKPQWVVGYNEQTLLRRCDDCETFGILVETKHYSIIVSYNQKFIINDQECVESHQLDLGDNVLTADGFQPLTSIVVLDGNHKMTNLKTEQGAFLANGFYLLSD